jgi:hypothetical protein
MYFEISPEMMKIKIEVKKVFYPTSQPDAFECEGHIMNPCNVFKELIS